MSLFNLPPKGPNDSELQQRLVDLIMNCLTDRNNRIRAEDALCGAATIVAERCIDAAGDYPLRDHTLAPGKRIFSDRVNQLLSGDVAVDDIDAVPANSIFGVLKARVNPSAYSKSHFPSVADVFRSYAAGVGKAEDWGKVPFTVPAHNHPGILPLRFAYETRRQVDSILHPVAHDKIRCLRIAIGALADLLNNVAGVMAPELALRLAFETVNGMAKTAPMTEQAMREAQATAQPTR